MGLHLSNTEKQSFNPLVVFNLFKFVIRNLQERMAFLKPGLKKDPASRFVPRFFLGGGRTIGRTCDVSTRWWCGCAFVNFTQEKKVESVVTRPGSINSPWHEEMKVKHISFSVASWSDFIYSLCTPLQASPIGEKNPRENYIFQLKVASCAGP